jgi:hypothetical protein
MSKLATARSPVVVDGSGFVYVDGVKIAKYLPERHCLQFLDKDKRRSDQRGSNVVEASLIDLVSIAKKK